MISGLGPISQLGIYFGIYFGILAWPCLVLSYLALTRVFPHVRHGLWPAYRIGGHTWSFKRGTASRSSAVEVECVSGEHLFHPSSYPQRGGWDRWRAGLWRPFGLGLGGFPSFHLGRPEDLIVPTLLGDGDREVVLWVVGHGLWVSYGPKRVRWYSPTINGPISGPLGTASKDNVFNISYATKNRFVTGRYSRTKLRFFRVTWDTSDCPGWVAIIVEIRPVDSWTIVRERGISDFYNLMSTSPSQS